MITKYYTSNPGEKWQLYWGIRDKVVYAAYKDSRDDRFTVQTMSHTDDVLKRASPIPNLLLILLGKDITLYDD